MVAVADRSLLRRVDWGRALQFILGSTLLFIYVPAVAGLPRVGTVMLGALAVYGAVLLALPRAWLFVLPVITVSLDLAPWSGRFLFSEYDGFVAITAAVSLLCGRMGLRGLQFNWWLVPLIAYIALYAANMSSLSDFWDPPGRQFENPYYSDSYSYKVGKGFFWGLALALLWLNQSVNDRRATLSAGVGGVASAAVMLFLLALWERGSVATLFSADNWWEVAHSILNFSGDYRITGIFADMHTGGEVIDGLMILSLPLLLMALFSQRAVATSIFLGLAVVSIGYCVIVGVTRATWAASAFAFVITLASYYALHRRQGLIDHGRATIIALIFFAAVFTARWLQSQGGSDALLAYAIGIVAIAVLKQQTYLHPFFRFGLFCISLVFIAYAVLTAHNSSRFAEPDALSQLMVPLSIVFLNVVLWFVWDRTTANVAGNSARLVLVLLIFPMGVAIALSGHSMEERMTTSESDLDTRATHWQRVIDSGAGSKRASWFGNGVGSFPRNYVTSYPETIARVGSFKVLSDGLARIQLGVSGNLEVIQRVRLDPGTEYLLSLRTRASEAGSIGVKLCRRNQLVFTVWGQPCVEKRINYGLPEARIDSEGFEHHSVAINSGTVPVVPRWFHWPVSFHLTHSRGQSPVEITNLGMFSGERSALVNGDFSLGMDQWFFYANFAHLPWHVKNLWLQVWYETGWVGLLLAGVLLFGCGWRAWCLGAKEPIIVAAFLAVLSVVAVGAFGSPLDSSRASLWFYFMLLIGLLQRGDVVAVGLRTEGKNSHLSQGKVDHA